MYMAIVHKCLTVPMIEHGIVTVHILDILCVYAHAY